MDLNFNPDLGRNLDRNLNLNLSPKPNLEVNFNQKILTNSSSISQECLAIEAAKIPNVAQSNLTYRAASKPDPRGVISCYQHIPDIWQDLVALLEYRRDLKVTVVRLFLREGYDFRKEEQNKMLINLRCRLGILDIHEAPVDVNGDTQ